MYKIFIDVDNTILEHTGFYSLETESRVHKSMGKNPSDNEQAIKVMYESALVTDPNNFRELFMRENVFILTKSSNEVYEKYKQMRIASILGVTHEQLISMRNSEGHLKYMYLGYEEEKAEVIKSVFNLKNLKKCILIDDFSENIVNWQENQGIGIKFYNEYNSAVHPTGGIVISNFKLFSVKNDELKYVFADSRTAYHLQHVKKGDPVVYISVLQLLQQDICETFNIDINKIDNTQSLNMKFLEEYYQFVERVDFNRIARPMSTLIDKSKVNIIANSFEYNKKPYKDYLGMDNIINIECVNEKKPKKSADIYISIPNGLNYEVKTTTFDCVARLLVNFLNKH